MPYTVTKNGKTFTELETDINSKTFLDIYKTIVVRMYPNSLFDGLDNGFVTDEGKYNGIKPYQLVVQIKVFDNKAPYNPDVLNEISDWQTENVDALIIEFDELQRVFDMGVRIDLILNWQQSAINVGVYNTFINFEIFKKAIIDANDDANLLLLEAENTILKTEADFQDRVNDKSKRIRLGIKAIATINQLNEDNSITGPQLIAQLSSTDVQAIMALLQTGSLISAKVQITGLVLTGLEPMDASYKTRIIAMIDKELGI